MDTRNGYVIVRAENLGQYAWVEVDRSDDFDTARAIARTRGAAVMFADDFQARVDEGTALSKSEDAR